jgi:hypothetical protein
MIWAWLAWLAWLAFLVHPAEAECYLALSLTGCAGVAVLGARRPGVWAWHAVVVGLLVVMLLPLAEGALTKGAVPLNGPRGVFLLGVLAVGIGNYVPTRLYGGAAALTAACSLAVFDFAQQSHEFAFLAAILAVCSPFAAWATAAWREDTNSFDRTWAGFRDRYGAVWAHRVREQFNAAARNAGLTVELTWRGGYGLSPEKQTAAEELLTALIRRFGV